MANKEELEEKLKKLIVRLKNVQEGKQLDTLIQILEDLLFLTFAGDCATELFEDKDVHLPLMVVLASYIDSHAVQEVGWSLLCRLMEVCPSTLEKVSAPQVEKDWEVLGIHQQILKMLSLHNGHSKLMMIGLRALSHLLESDAILLMILEENVDVFLLIVDAMTVFCSNEEIQIYGCKSLQLLLEKVPDVHLIEFVETQDHNAILNAARQFQDNEDTVLHALRVLLPLAGPASNIEVLMSGNERCYSLIMCAMGSYPNNEKLQEVGCRLFLKFTSESYYNILVLNGVHKVIVKASEMYPRNASLQASALFCLASLTETIILNKDLDEWKEEDDICWVDSCCRALELHRANAVVQEAACWALNNLLVYESQLHEMFGDDEGRYPVHRQVMASMLLHSSSQSVFQAAANTLATLVDQNGKIRALLLSNGLHINIIDMMKKHSTSPDVAESACRLLYKLFQVRMTTLDEVTMAMAEILNAMKTHNSVLSVQLEGLRASLMLLNPDRRLKEHGSSVGDPDMVDVTLKVLKNQCVLEGAHTVFLEALNKFIGSPAIQECGLNVLSALAESSGALELMSQQGALDTVLHTLQMFPEEKEIHFLALNLLHSLISKQKMSPAAVPVLASVLMKSLQRYHDILEVQFKGLQVAWKLLNLSTIAAEELAKESFDTVIFQQMNNCLLEQKNNSVLNLCCMCLSKMAHDSDIKYSMLEKACAVCDIVMAECLIQLGADINKKTKKESLICQVCERTSCPELVELLLKSGTHEQHIRKALNISIRKHDGPVISLLLKKLGLDLANNAICLGGFRLGHIESSWLSPLFLERRTCSFRRRTMTQCFPKQERGKTTNHLACLCLTHDTIKMSYYFLTVLCSFPWAEYILLGVTNHGSKQFKISLCKITRKKVCHMFKGSYGIHSLQSHFYSVSNSVWNTIGRLLHNSSTRNSVILCFIVCCVKYSLRRHSGSDGILHIKRISQSDLSGEFRGSFVTAQKVRHRHPSSEGESGDSEQSEVHRQRLSRRSSNQKSRFSSILTSPEHSSLFYVDKECIKLLDLSGNELDSLNTIAGQNSITAYLEHIVRLELNQNNLTEFSLTLCETLKGVTHLDLHSNKFQSLPTGVLSMLSLKVLNLSRNDIGPCLSLDPMIRCSNLKQLVLSYNQLSSFPDHLGQVIQTLEELYLEGNKIAEITSPLPLPELRVLDVSKNDIMEICENFLSDCPKLESFNVSMNKLRHLPDLPSKLTTIKLSHNEFTCVPDAIVKLPYLRSIDMRNNQITVLPSPSEWESSNLRELVFSHNQISELNLSGPVYKWARLEKLHLCKNKLKEIPPQIGLLENVTSLDVSKNSDLRSFPNEMGKLERLWDLPLDELQLDLDLKHIGSKTKDIIRFLQQRLKKSVPYYRMKLIVVGNSESGKTALLNQLMKLKRSQCRTEKMAVAIDVKDWAIRDKGKKSIVLNVWDFSGREEFYGSHTHFLTPRALYLVVYDLSKGAAEVDAIKPWLFNIKARASSSPVILVGTHMDVTEEKHLQACVVKISNELLNHQGFPVIRDCHIVTATEDSDSIGKLRKAIVKEVMNFRIQDQPVIGQLIPDSYLELEKKILQERERVPAEFPVICQQRLLDIVQENQLHLDESELPHAIHFLSESGVLLHFDDPALQLRDLYFVDPQWLCNIISQILTLNGEGLSKYPKGIVQRSVVENFLFEKKSFPRNYVTQYFKLLEKFQIALPFGEDQLLIPSSLADSRPVIELPHCENSEIIVRLYEMPYFPMGFWSRLINRLLEVSMFMLNGRERALRPNRMYWRKGIYLNWSPEAYCLVESTTMDNVPESFVKITVPCSQKGRVLLGQVVDHIDSLLEEWFPGLLTTDVHGNGETLLKKWALYSFEDGQGWRRILLEELLEQMDKECLLVNPVDPRSTIPISQIAPDLVLCDLPANIMLNSDQLEMDLTSEYLLGKDGGFGSVYRAVYKNEDVAVKIFIKHASEMYLHRLMRQELAVLSHLHHPSLISLLAAGTQPRMLVMELAPRGSLDCLFEQKNGILNRTLQHRIALHVADGLRYLHFSMVVYRDLKPHNVLLFNLKTDSDIIAKIADYGIAQYCCSMGIKTSEGTPGFRAPEVARGNVIYNQQADIYSFGLLLYDLLTGGERITDGMKFPSEFDEIAVQGKLPDPVKHYNCSPWPGFESLMKHCLKENPEDRPTSSQVFERLSSGELLCLMREVPVPGAVNAECFGVSSQSKKPRVWIGSGSSRRTGQVGVLDLETGKYVPQDVDNSPVLCLTMVCFPGEKDEWVVAGTHSGKLIVINTEDTASKHTLQNMTDAVTCFKEKNFLLVGTADGVLSVFEDTAIKVKQQKKVLEQCLSHELQHTLELSLFGYSNQDLSLTSLEEWHLLQSSVLSHSTVIVILASSRLGTLRCIKYAFLQSENGKPQKILQIGNINTPLVCLSESAYSQDKNTIWAGCGAKVVSLTKDYDIWKTIDIKPNYQLQQRSCSETNIIRMAVDKYIYLTKKESHVVEIWDKKTERMTELIDCSHFLKFMHLMNKEYKHSMDIIKNLFSVRVKTLLLQQNITLWIGTRGGHMILVDLSTRQPIRVIPDLCESIRSMAMAQIDKMNPRSIVLVLGRPYETSPAQFKHQHENEKSVMYIWNQNLPLEVQSLQKHCEMRQEIAEKMRMTPFD
ncbi:LRRK2 kinase, partial [Atractosteus spatula]|nr:LRRK2 kinase [Atractosteus spatula]